ncbi:MAG TPA: DUF790 family protein [Candidatus Bathyarchaeia archaeon]|nr:DUF790 family protein [Candidatus Bathyarchaeia archaeon]
MYAPLERPYVELASQLIEAYTAHLGKRKGTLAEQCKQFEGARFDFRLVRGLVALLDRSATFEARSYIDPQEARLEVFLEASRYPLVATDELKQKVISRAASRLRISAAQLEESLWSDFDDELLLQQFTPPSADELIRQYNLSLTQTLVFKAASLEFVAGSNYQRIFSRLKYLGLMYSVERTGEVYSVLVDGPVALFKLTERYGSSLAKLLPQIVQADRWSLKAQIISGERQSPKLLTMELDSKTANDLFPKPSDMVINERYDSSIEAAFARSFNALKLGWALRREPGLLTAGKYVFIPDFGFEKNGLKAYLEVVGFWTDEYLEKKLAKLQAVNVPNLLVAVNRNLSCSQFKQIKGLVIFYDKKVPLKPIVDYLKQLEETAIERQAQSIEGLRLRFEGEIVDIEQVAEEHHVSVPALARWLQANPRGAYHLIGTQLISHKKLMAIADKLQQLVDDTLPAALAAIEEEGVTSPEKILDALRYSVVWRGIDPDHATIRKRP